MWAQPKWINKSAATIGRRRNRSPDGTASFRRLTSTPTDPTPKPPKVKQPPVLFEKTQAAIAQLAERLGGPLMTYWNNPRGSVCHSDVVALYDVLGRLGTHDTIYLFIKSDGGSGQASLRIVNVLREHCRRPSRWCRSSALGRDDDRPRRRPHPDGPHGVSHVGGHLAHPRSVADRSRQRPR